MSATETLTTLSPWAIPATHSLPRIAASPWATASYNVAAVTSTVCETPSVSWIVTRQDRTDIGARYHIRLFFAILQEHKLNEIPALDCATKTSQTHITSSTLGGLLPPR